MINNSVEREANIVDFIEKSKENSLNVNNIYLSVQYPNIQFPIKSILSDRYRSIILENTSEVTLDEASFKRFKYQPKALSLELYGTIDLWHLLLWINNMVSTTEFSRRKLFVYNPNAMDILNKIVEREKGFLYKNKMNPQRPIEIEPKYRR